MDCLAQKVAVRARLRDRRAGDGARASASHDRLCRSPDVGSVRAVEADVRTELLRFIAAHRFVCGSHPERFAQDDELGRVLAHELVLAGLVRRVRWSGCDLAWVVTSTGLDAIGSGMPVPGIDFGRLRHDATVPAVWLALRESEPQTRWRTARELAAWDTVSEAAGGAAPVGVRVAGSPERVSYPDLWVETPVGWGGIVVVLSPPAAGWLEAVMTAFGKESRYWRVVFLVDRAEVSEMVERTADQLGLGDLVGIQNVTYAGRRRAVDAVAPVV